MEDKTGIIYLRLSDFRDEDETTFTEREAELRDIADDLGVHVPEGPAGVVIENDVSDPTRKARGASAYKATSRVHANGLVTYRTKRPAFAAVLQRLQNGSGGLVLIVGDESRISRDWRDGLDLIDACREGSASVVAPGDEEPRWILTDGGTRSEVSAFKDRINDARKYSEDIAAKVRKGRKRWAGKSYHGGVRPFGFQHVPGTDQHKRTLAVDEAEAPLLRKAGDDVLKKVSLASIAASWRDNGVATTRGAKWTASTVRDVLVKPATAGLAVKNGEFIDAPWPAIIDRDKWEKIREVLTDPTRRTSPGNTVRWLLSGLAVCGICGNAKTVHVTGANSNPSYVCSGHMRRSARATEEFVERVIIARLGQPDIADLLKPVARPGTDTAKLRAELRELGRKKGQLTVLLTDGDLEAADYAAAVRQIKRRMEAAQAQLSAATEPDQLAEFRDPAADAATVWEGLSLGRRREIIRLLMTVTLVKAKRTGPVFNPDSIRIEWRSDLDSEKLAA
jgi:site-specific DNA recombinase